VPARPQLRTWHYVGRAGRALPSPYRHARALIRRLGGAALCSRRAWRHWGRQKWRPGWWDWGGIGARMNMSFDRGASGRTIEQQFHRTDLVLPPSSSTLLMVHAATYSAAVSPTLGTSSPSRHSVCLLPPSPSFPHAPLSSSSILASSASSAPPRLKRHSLYASLSVVVRP